MNAPWQVVDRWRGLDVVVRDLPLALFFAAASFVPAFHGLGTEVGELPARAFDGTTVVAIVLLCAPLAVRRRWPALCMVLVSLGFALDQLRGYHTFAGGALAVALLSAGVHLERRRRTVVVCLTGAYLVLAVALDRAGGDERPEGYLMFCLALVLVWAIGSWVRSSRAAEAAHRERVAQDSRTAERARIARELHDVVTHHVTAMVVQAEAAQYLTASPDRLDTALTAVADTGREAIGDLRHLLDLLDPGHDAPGGRPDHEAAASRTPPGGDLGALVAQARRAGQPVDLAEVGTPGASSGAAELTAYRVVQEALTNALKHAAGRRTTVDVRYTDQEITVQISTSGPGAAAGPPAPIVLTGSGRGLAGLRDRVDAVGGELATRRLDDGGFVVHAVVPRASTDRALKP